MGVKYDGGAGGGPVFADVPFLAANFAATGAMTWTVDQADVVTFQFALLGKQLTIWLRLVNSTVGGVVAGANLTLKLPAGLVAAKETVNCFTAAPGGGTTESIIAFCAAGATVVILQRYAANWVAGANNTDVNGVLTIQVQ